MKIARRDNEPETRTAYVIPEKLFGYWFAVTRNDNTHYGARSYKWSVSQIDSGRLVGMHYETRMKAVNSFINEMEGLRVMNGEEKMERTIRRGINKAGIINIVK